MRLPTRLVEDTYGYDKEHQRQKDSGERFILAVSILMPAVRLFAGDADHGQHDDIADEIGERVDAVGYQSRTGGEHAGQYFGDTQGGVTPEAYPCDMAALLDALFGSKSLIHYLKILHAKR